MQLRSRKTWKPNGRLESRRKAKVNPTPTNKQMNPTRTACHFDTRGMITLFGASTNQDCHALSGTGLTTVKVVWKPDTTVDLHNHSTGTRNTTKEFGGTD